MILLVRDRSVCNGLSVGDGRSLSRLFFYHGVETIVVVRGVVHNTTTSISLDEAVAALDSIAVPGLLLALRIAGQMIVDIVRKAVLRVVVERFFVVWRLGIQSFGNGCSVCQGCREALTRLCGVIGNGVRLQKSCTGCSDEGCESDKLHRKTTLFFQFYEKFLVVKINAVGIGNLKTL